jgi:hypothetical protein
MIADDLVNQIIIIMLWIGLWGIIDNVIEKYIPETNHNLRIAIFFVILAISLFLIRIRKIFLDGNDKHNKNVFN